MSTTPSEIATLTAESRDLVGYFQAQRDNHEGRITTKEQQVDSFITDAADRIGNTPFEIDLTDPKFSEHRYYPVYMLMTANQPLEIKIERYYSMTRRSGVGLAGTFLHFIATGGTWGGNPLNIHVIYNEQTYLQTIGAMGFGGRYHPILYIRGGYLYKGRSSLANPNIQIMSENTKYYDHGDDQHDLTAGPVGEAPINDSGQRLPLKSAFHSLGSASLNLVETVYQPS